MMLRCDLGFSGPVTVMSHGTLWHKCPDIPDTITLQRWYNYTFVRRHVSDDSSIRYILCYYDCCHYRNTCEPG